MRKEANKNCADKSWASFLCILALSSVCIRSIFSLYPDSGEKLFKDLFNCVIQPTGESINSQPNINILFCRSGITRLHKMNNTIKIPGKLFCTSYSCWCDCKHKQNPVSTNSQYKFRSLKEWSTASKSWICFSSVSKLTISLKKLPKENKTDTVPTSVKLTPLKLET